MTSRLLPLAHRASSRTEDDLVELTTTVAARPEKKQRTDLLRAIVSGPVADRVPARRPPRGAGDPRPRARTRPWPARRRRALEALGGSAFPVARRELHGARLVGPRPAARHLPSRRRPARRSPPSTSAPSTSIRAAAAVSTPGSSPAPVAASRRRSSLVVRWSFRDGREGRAARARRPWSCRPYDATLFGPVLASLAGQAAPGAVRADRPRSRPATSRTPRTWPSATSASRCTEPDASPFLLSTPTHTDASLDFGVLVERLRHSARVGFGPLDLLAGDPPARPGRPGRRAADLDGLAPRAARTSRPRTRTRVPRRRRPTCATPWPPAACSRPPITVARMEAEGWVPDKVPRSPATATSSIPRANHADALLGGDAAGARSPTSALGVDDRRLGYADGYVGSRDRVVLRSSSRGRPTSGCGPSGLWHGYAELVGGPRTTSSRVAADRRRPCHDLLLAGYAAERPDSRHEIVDLTLALDRRWPVRPGAPAWPPPGPGCGWGGSTSPGAPRRGSRCSWPAGCGRPGRVAHRHRRASPPTCLASPRVWPTCCGC